MYFIEKVRKRVLAKVLAFGVCASGPFLWAGEKAEFFAAARPGKAVLTEGIFGFCL
jgi:hypothetical protein